MGARDREQLRHAGPQPLLRRPALGSGPLHRPRRSGHPGEPSPSSDLSGGPGFKFHDEKVDSPLYKSGAYQPGALAMANAGPNTNGSQFFITVSSFTLPPDYNLFGEVISGLSVVNKVKKGDIMHITVREQLP